VDRLLEACAARSFALTRRELEEVVARNDKRRFSFDASGERIRANQGHSIEVDYVGGRHGPPAVLEVAAARMAADGHTFYVSDNGVWLVEAVPPEFLSRH
jgi:putative RNA 2'-phosphotransferase